MTIGVRKTNLVEYSLPDGKGGRTALNQVNSEKDRGHNRHKPHIPRAHDKKG